MKKLEHRRDSSAFLGGMQKQKELNMNRFSKA